MKYSYKILIPSLIWFTVNISLLAAGEGKGDNTEVDGSARLAGDFNTALSTRLSTGQMKGIIKLSPDKPYHNVNVPFEGLEQYMDNPEQYAFNELFIHYDFTEGNSKITVNDCEVLYKGDFADEFSQVGGIAYPDDDCCPYRKGIELTRPNIIRDFDSEYELRIANNYSAGGNNYKSQILKTHNGVTTPLDLLSYRSGYSMSKIPVNHHLSLALPYSKRSQSSYNKHYVKINNVDITNKFHRRRIQNKSGVIATKKGQEIYFDKVGLYRLEGWIEFEHVRIGRNSFPERKVSLWICVYPDKGFPTFNGQLSEVDVDCSASQLSFVGTKLPVPFEYVYSIGARGDKSNRAWSLGDRAGIHRGSHTTRLINGVAPGMFANLWVRNPCTGETSRNYLSVKLNPYPIPRSTMSGGSVCLGESGELRGPDKMRSYKWYLRKYIEPFPGVIRETWVHIAKYDGKKALKIGPGDGVDIVYTGIGSQGTYGLSVQDNQNGCWSLILGKEVFIHPEADNPAFTLDRNKYRLGDVIKPDIIVNSEGSKVSWGDGKISYFDPNIEYAHVYDRTGTFTIEYMTNTPNGCSMQLSKPIVVYAPLCSTSIPATTGGAFKRDRYTGSIIYDREDCSSYIVMDCMTGQGQHEEVVTTSAVTFSEDWEYTDELYKDSRAVDNLNDFESGKRGKWRVKDTYAYNIPRSYETNNGNNKLRNKEAGTFRQQHFNWQSSGISSASWVKSSTVDRYSPNGEVLQETNALGISSAAKFGYYDAIPYIIAQNATSDEILFESFENVYRDKSLRYLEDNWQIDQFQLLIDSDTRHSGLRSGKFFGTNKLALPVMPLTDHVKDKGILLQFWFYNDLTTGGVSIVPNLNIVAHGIHDVSPDQVIQVAQNGKWRLINAYFNITTGTHYQIEIEYIGAGTNHIDDIRVQPTDAQSTAYVYDAKTLRLLTTFDDQHFGLYYQYNAEGKLIRKQIETVEGIKTIQETQYNSRGEEY